MKIKLDVELLIDEPTTWDYPGGPEVIDNWEIEVDYNEETDELSDIASDWVYDHERDLDGKCNHVKVYDKEGNLLYED